MSVMTLSDGALVPCLLVRLQTMMLGQEPRQTTSNLGHLNKPSIQALIHGLNRHYYSIAINYRQVDAANSGAILTQCSVAAKPQVQLQQAIVLLDCMCLWHVVGVQCSVKHLNQNT